MKKLLAGLLAVVLLSGVAPRISLADMVPGPSVPERKTPRKPEFRVQTVPIYSVAAGVVAVALTGSLIVLARIRKKSLQSETPETNQD